MGSSNKRPRYVQHSSSGLEDDSDTENQRPNQEEEDYEMVEEDDYYEEDNDEGEQDQEGNVDAQRQCGAQKNEMEELEKEYMALRQKEQDLLQNLKRHKDEDILKGRAVKNQKALWDKTLELRFLLQKVFSSSNRLPQEHIRASFCGLDERASSAYSDLIASSEKTIQSIFELQEALLENNPSIEQAAEGNIGQLSKHQESKNVDVQDDEEWVHIAEMHSRMVPFRDKSIDKWQRKTQVTTGAAAIKGKFQAFNQNISEQVASYMRDPSRMIKQMQLRRSTVAVFGSANEVESCSKDENGNASGDPELLEDTEFYQQLLKEFFETFDPSSSEMAAYDMRRMKNKKRKVVDRRASKNRKIRYDVHEKIVNFMAPERMEVPPMAPKLFANLFGLKTQHHPASVPMSLS